MNDRQINMGKLGKIQGASQPRPTQSLRNGRFPTVVNGAKILAQSEMPKPKPPDHRFLWSPLVGEINALSLFLHQWSQETGRIGVPTDQNSGGTEKPGSFLRPSRAEYLSSSGSASFGRWEYQSFQACLGTSYCYHGLEEDSVMDRQNSRGIRDQCHGISTWTSRTRIAQTPNTELELPNFVFFLLTMSRIGEKPAAPWLSRWRGKNRSSFSARQHEAPAAGRNHRDQVTLKADPRRRNAQIPTKAHVSEDLQKERNKTYYNNEYQSEDSVSLHQVPVSAQQLVLTKDVLFPRNDTNVRDLLMP